jgi:23S rRNA G2445 N2-methylase RlmL
MNETDLNARDDVDKEHVILMATVVTGLEQVARHELKTKCPSIEIIKPSDKMFDNQHGRIFFKIYDEKDLGFLDSMWSLERLYIVAQCKKIPGICLQKQPDTDISKDEELRDIKLISNQLISMDNKLDYDRALHMHSKFNKNKPQNTFRVTAKRGGIHRFKSMNLATYIAEEISGLYPSWQADLNNYDIEVFVYIHFDLCLVAFTAISTSISLKRFESEEGNNHSRLKLTALSLKPSIAYGMVHFAGVKSGDVVVDICCGSGIIPLVTHEIHNNIILISGDYSLTVLEKALFNAEISNPPANEIDFFHWSFTQLPLRTESIDVIISNLPFGIKVGTRELNRRIYPRMMQELARVLKSGVGRAILLSTEKSLMHNGIKQNQRLIKLVNRITINMGGIDVFLYTIEKKSEKSQKKKRGRSSRRKRKPQDFGS